MDLFWLTGLVSCRSLILICVCVSREGRKGLEGIIVAKLPARSRPGMGGRVIYIRFGNIRYGVNVLVD